MSMLFVIYTPVSEPEAISKDDAFGRSRKVSVAALYKRYLEQIRSSRSGTENTAPTPMPDQPSHPPTTETAKRRFFGGLSKKKSELLTRAESGTAVKSSTAAGAQRVTAGNSEIVQDGLQSQSSDRYVSEEQTADELQLSPVRVSVDDSNLSQTTDEVLTLREVG